MRPGATASPDASAAFQPLNQTDPLPRPGAQCPSPNDVLGCRAHSRANYATARPSGGDQMRLGLFLTTLIGLAGASHISSAADATWAAVGALEDGESRL